MHSCTLVDWRSSSSDRTETAILTVQNRQKIVVKITLMLCAKFYLRGDHKVIVMQNFLSETRYDANDRGRGSEEHFFIAAPSVRISRAFLLHSV